MSQESEPERTRILERMQQLADHLETELPADSGVMVWFYKRSDPDADIAFCASHSDDHETLRVLWETIGRLIAQEEIAMKHRLRLFVADADPSTPPSYLLISSATLVPLGPDHERLRLWSRGGHAGDLIVQTGDGEALARMLQLRALEDSERPSAEA